MQNRLYFQRTKQALNEGKALSDKELAVLLKRDQDIKYAYGALKDNELGYPGAAAEAIDANAYQQFLQEYMNDVIPVVVADGQIFEMSKPGLERKAYYY
jgi:hypothetical protein